MSFPKKTFLFLSTAVNGDELYEGDLLAVKVSEDLDGNKKASFVDCGHGYADVVDAMLYGVSCSGYVADEYVRTVADVEAEMAEAVAALTSELASVTAERDALIVKASQCDAMSDLLVKVARRMKRIGKPRDILVQFLQSGEVLTVDELTLSVAPPRPAAELRATKSFVAPLKAAPAAVEPKTFYDVGAAREIEPPPGAEGALETFRRAKLQSSLKPTSVTPRTARGVLMGLIVTKAELSQAAEFFMSLEISVWKMFGAGLADYVKSSISWDEESSYTAINHARNSVAEVGAYEYVSQVKEVMRLISDYRK